MTQTTDSPSWTGSAALLGAIVLFSTVEIASKAIQVTCDATIDPYFLVFLRFFVTGLCLLSLGLPGAWRRGLRLHASDVGILAFIGAWNNYMLPLFILSDPNKYTLPLGVQAFASQHSVDTAAVLAFTSLSMLPALLFFSIFERRIVGGLTGAVKG